MIKKNNTKTLNSTFTLHPPDIRTETNTGIVEGTNKTPSIIVFGD